MCITIKYKNREAYSMSPNKNKSFFPATTVPSDSKGECSGRDENFGKYLRERRKAKNMSLRQLASKAKVGYSELSRIEHGKIASASTLRKLCPYLSEPFDVLLAKAGYSFQTDTDSSIYIDLQGNKIDLEEKALKLYTKNVEFFFQLDHWIENSSEEDMELISQFIKIMEKRDKLNKESSDTTSIKKSYLSIFDSIKSSMQASLHLYFASNPQTEKKGVSPMDSSVESPLA